MDDFIILSVLLVLSGVFSGSETAMTASSEPRMYELARQGSRRACRSYQSRIVCGSGSVTGGKAWLGIVAGEASF